MFARLKAKAASERVTLKQLLRSYVEQGLNTDAPAATTPRSAASLPRLDSPLAITGDQRTNARLFALLEPSPQRP